jgi:hypothetical protein
MLDQDLTTLTDLLPLFRLAPPAAVDQIESAWVNTGQNGKISRFCRKPMSFLDSTKISSRSSRSFSVKPRFFRVLYSLVLASSTKRILVILAPFLAFFMSTRSSRRVEQFYALVLFC